MSVVREVLELMRLHVQREGFALQLTAAESSPLVQLDVDALEQMLFNALEYGRADAGSKIEVACAAAADGGAVLSARDDGHGVAEAHLHAVFEPFFRGESELTRRQQVTGLGLALVRDLAELMRGNVQGVHRSGIWNRCVGKHVRLQIEDDATDTWGCIGVSGFTLQ